jgi:hypothetical protein
VEILFAGAGLALLIAAAIGRPVKLAGNEIPAPETRSARVVTGMLGVGCVVAAFVIGGLIEIPTLNGSGASPSPSSNATQSPTATPSGTAEPTATGAGQLQPCVAPAGASTFPRLTNADPTITTGSRLCLIGADLFTLGTGEGLVRVVAGTTELIRFDMRDFDFTGEEGAGSGERHIDFQPDIGVPTGTDIRLDVAGCSGEACTRLEIVFSAGTDAG